MDKILLDMKETARIYEVRAAHYDTRRRTDARVMEASYRNIASELKSWINRIETETK